MKRLNLIAIGFIVVVLAQIAVPAFMIARHEHTLRSGERFLFQCAPIDPVDVFRGRYVALTFAQDTADGGNLDFTSNGNAFAEVIVADDGYARLGRLFKAPPASGTFLRVKVAWWHRVDPESGNGNLVRVSLPFNRYYMEENLAIGAEKAYLGLDSEGPSRAHAAVRILNGYAVIEDLYLDGMEVRQYLESVDVPVR